MVSTLCGAQPIKVGEGYEHWLFYTDIYQRYQFRYPASGTVTRQKGKAYLHFEQNGKSDLPSPAWVGCRFVICKPQPFHDLINLEEYLRFQDRRHKLSYAANRSPISGLQPGYRGIRETHHQGGGMDSTIIYISYQARIMEIQAAIPKGMDQDIKLVRSVRFI
jgi:hypothetical protein